MTDLFAWNEEATGDDDVFFASTSRSIDDGSFHLAIHTDQMDDLADWEDSNFASYESYEHLLSTDVEVDSDYAHFLQTQNFELDHLLSPPSKPSNFKKRVSPAKDIQHKRTKSQENRNSWKARPDHMDVLGSSVGSNASSLGTGGLVEAFAAPTLLSPLHTLGVMPELHIEESLTIFGTEDLDEHAPLTTSTPNATPNRPTRRATGPASSGAASAGKKTALDWSDDEIRLFEEGLVLYGAPNWRQIAALIGTRNTSQVKTFSVKYFSTHGPNVVPHIDPVRLEELRAQYLPHSSPTTLNKSGRLKRSSNAIPPPSPSSGSSSLGAGSNTPNASKLVTPKKTSPPHGNGGSMGSGGFSGNLSGKGPGKHHLSSAPNGSPGAFAPNKGPNKGPGRVASARRKADEQLIVLKKTGDEDEDICIEDEDIDVDGDDDDDEDRAFIRAVVVDDEDGSEIDAEDEVEQFDDDTMSSSTTALAMDLGSDNLGPMKTSAPNSVAGKNHTPLWRQKPNTFPLDESGEFMRDDSYSVYSDADSSVAGNETMSLHDSTSSLQSATVSIAQALKALGLEGEAWIEDVEIPPSKVLELQEDHVLDLEMQANSEFFEGNAVKTPERYVRIRNHIVRTWAMNKQRYITKTSVRRGLRDCGDVNAIGRVHQFLELVGAINFGLEAPPSCRKQGQPEPLSVLMMNKAPLQLHLQQQQMMRSRPSPLASSANVPLQMPPTYASVAAGTVSSTGMLLSQSSSSVPSLNSSTSSSLASQPHHAPIFPSPSSRPTSVRAQFDSTFEVIKNPQAILPTLVASSNIMLVVDLHAQLHRRDGFGLIAGFYDATNNAVHLRHAIPYTGPQNAAASSFQAVAQWEKSVTSWIEHSTTSKQAAAAGTPLEVVGYYTTHKLNGAISLTQFTHYRNVFCKGAARNRPFVGIFAMPFERTPDSTLFYSVMYPVGPSAPPVTPGAPQKTLWLLKRNVLCERKLPQEQFAQLFAQYAGSEIALALTERDDRDPHRTLLDRCLVSLSSSVFVSERDKNALWEHMRVLAAEGVSPKLLAMLNTKDAVWSFKEPPAPLVPLDHSNQMLPLVSSPSAPSSNMVMMMNPVGMQQQPSQPQQQAPSSYASHDPYGSTAQKLDFSSVAMHNSTLDTLGHLDMDAHSSFNSHLEPRF